MKFDELFYIQDARADLYHSSVSKDDFVGLSGTKKYPVKTMGDIDSLDIDLDILGPSSPLLSTDEITLNLIMFQLHHFYSLPAIGRLYYMQFLFYDFDRVTCLFLLNARIIKISRIPGISHKGNRYALTIISTKRNLRAAYETYETKHDTEWKNGG